MVSTQHHPTSSSPSTIIHNCVTIDDMDPSKETILFEYIPKVLYTKQVLNGSKVDIGADSGVIMIVMLNGDVFFYPSNVNLLDQLPDIFMNSGGNSNNSKNAAAAAAANAKKNNLKSKYNIPLNLSSEHKVFNFDFKQVDPTENYIYKPHEHQQSTSNSSSSTTSTSTTSTTTSPTSPNETREQQTAQQQQAQQQAQQQLIQQEKERERLEKEKEKPIKVSDSPFKAPILQESSNSTNILSGTVGNHLLLGEPIFPGSHDFIEFNPIKYRRPRKIIVSHDKKLLLIIGCYVKGISCLTIYRILEEGPNYFQLLFYDSSFTYLDACFSSDSTTLASVLSRYPNFIFILQIPGIQNKPTICNLHGTANGESASSTTSPNNSNSNGSSKYIESIEYQEKRIVFEPRKIGPLAIIGPVKNCLGLPFHMTHISSNPIFEDKIRAFEFITWNDEGIGEYCFWNVYKDSSNSNNNSNNNSSNSGNIKNNSPLKNIPLLKFEWMTKFVAPIVPDKAWIEKETSPKNQIISMEFSPHGDLVMVIVKKENHDHKNKLSNGIGFQCIPSTLELLTYNNQSNNSNISSGNSGSGGSSGNHHDYKNNSGRNGHGNQNQNNFNNNNQNKGMVGGDLSSSWFQVSESIDKSVIIASKWTDSLFFGGSSQYLPSVLVKEKGIYELVSNNYCAQFTNASEEFMKTCVNFIQMGKYHRLWISTYGILYSITMTPKNDKYIEWIPTVFEASQTGGNTGSGNISANRNSALALTQSKYYKVSQMIGYTLIDFTKELSKQETNSKNINKKKLDDLLATIQSTSSINEKSGKGDAEIYGCLHLYKCWSCKLTLIKPLVCGHCKTVAYCSRDCQKDHYPTHKPVCIPPVMPNQSTSTTSTSPSSTSTVSSTLSPTSPTQQQTSTSPTTTQQLQHLQQLQFHHQQLQQQQAQQQQAHDLKLTKNKDLHTQHLQLQQQQKQLEQQQKQLELLQQQKQHQQHIQQQLIKQQAYQNQLLQEQQQKQQEIKQQQQELRQQLHNQQQQKNNK